MAIQSIDEEGNLTWNCPHIGEKDGPCGQAHTHHISHEAIQWSARSPNPASQSMVSLPPCSVCGGQTFLKVVFTDKELKAPNMWIAWTSERAQNLVDFQKSLAEAEPESVHAQLLIEQIKLLEAIKAANGLHTNSHAMALRHVELAKQLVASGKVPPVQGES